MVIRVLRRYSGAFIRHAGLVEKWDTNLLRRIRRFVGFVANSAQMEKVSR